MADEIRDPRAAANLEALNASLSQGRRLLEGALETGVQLLGETGQQVAGEIRAAASEAKRLTPAAPGVGPRDIIGGGPRTPAKVRTEAAADRDAAAAARELAAAKTDQARAEQEIARASEAVRRARSGEAEPVNPLLAAARRVQSVADPRIAAIESAAASLPQRPGAYSANPAGMLRAAQEMAQADARARAELEAAARAAQRGAEMQAAWTQEAARMARTLPSAERLALPPGATTAVPSGGAYGLTANELRMRAERGIPFQSDLTSQEARDTIDAAARYRAQSGGGRGQGPPIPRVGVGGADDDAAYNRLNELRRGAAAAAQEEARLTAELQRSAAALGLSSQQMQKHGYLTSEFIDAARKGQVTIRELGDQVLGTVAKFGAWTAAASLVYGVVNALGAVSRGGLEAANGVARVNSVLGQSGGTVAPQHAQRTFESLSQQFNVPISDAADAVYGSAKVFGDFDSAVVGARTSLFAMKVAELDAATSTNTLNGIVKGFALSAADLPDVLDTINFLTNRFGGNTGQLAQGVAKAAGQFRIAGGTYQQLIGLLSAGTQMTGAPATEVATAIGRSASVVATPAGAQRARAAGLDPTLDPVSLIQQAQRLYRQNPTRDRAQELARAIIPAGGQFARIFVPLITQADRVDKALATAVDPKRHGSAAQELARRLGAPSEQLKALGNNLEQIGSALSRVGAFQPFGLMLHGLNDVLRLTHTLIGALNAIPGHQLAVPALEAMAVMRGLRYFNVGGQVPAFQNRRLEAFRQGLERSPEQQTIQLGRQGLDEQVKVARDMQSQTARQATMATFRYREANANLARLGAEGASEQELEAATARLARARTAATIAEEEAVAALRFAQASNTARTQFNSSLKQGMTAEQAFANAGIAYRPNDVGRPSPTMPVRTGSNLSSGGVILPPHVSGVGDPTATANAARSASRVSQNATRLAGSLDQGVLRMQEAARASQTMGVAGNAVAGGIGLVRGAFITGSAAVVGLGASIRTFATSAAAALGPLDAVLAGLFIGYSTWSSTRQANRDFFAATQDPYSSQADVAARKAVDARRNRGIGGQALSWTRNALADTVNFLDPFGNPAGGDPGDRRAEAGADVEQERRALAAAQKKGALLHLNQIQERFTRNLATLGKNRALSEAAKEIRSSFAYNSGGLAGRTLAQQQQDRQAADDLMKSMRDQANAKQEEDFKKAQALYEARTGLQQERAPNALAAARVGVQRMNARLPAIAKEYGRNSAEYVQALTDAEKQQDTVIQQQLALAQSRTARAVSRTHDPLKAIQLQLDGINDRLDKTAREYGRNSSEYLDLLTQRNQLREQRFQENLSRAEAQTGAYAADTADPIAQAQRTLDGINDRIARVAQRYGEQSTQYLNLLQQRRQQQQQLVQAQLQRGQSLRALSTAAAFQGGSNQGAELQRAITDAQGNLAAARAGGDQVSPDTIIDLQRGVYDARKAYADYARQQAEAMVNARAEYALAGTDDPVRQARIELQRAQGLVQFAQTPADRLSAQAQVRSRRRDVTHARQQSAFDDIEFEADIGRIEHDTELHRLEMLLHTIHGNQQLRRDIQRRIAALKRDASNTSSLDLDIGSIQLPTTYEIRRAVRGGLDSRRTVNVVNQLGGVVVHSNNPDAVGDAIEQRFATSTTAAFRSSS